MKGFGDFTSALKMRDVIRSMIRVELGRSGAIPVYGTVQSVDPGGNRAQVLLNGETSPVWVTMNSLQPTKAGQVVRILGPDGGMYIDDVISTGPIVVQGAPVPDPDGPIINVRKRGAPTSGDAAPAIQHIIDTSAPGDHLLFDRWFTVGSMPLFKTGRSYLGSDKMTAGLRMANGANLTAVAANEDWYNNTADHGGSMVVQHMGFDGNAANNTLGHGLIVMNWPTVVDDCYFTGCTNDNILMTTARRDNTVITGKLQEIYITGNKMDPCGGSGIHGLDSSAAGKLNDGFITDNVIWGGEYGIKMDCSAGWDISGNHPFGQTFDGIRLANCFATTVSNNYVEQYGLEAAVGGYYAAIAMTFIEGRASTVSGNNMFAPILGTAGGNIRGLTLYALTSQDAAVVSTGNAYGGGNYTGEIGFSYEYATGATLTVAKSALLPINAATNQYVQGVGVTFV